MLFKVQLFPLEAIEEEGSIIANFYGDCTMIPDPSELDVVEKDFLILDDCLLGLQNKAEEYYTSTTSNDKRKHQFYYTVSTRCKRSDAYTRRSSLQEFKDYCRSVE